MAMPVQTLAGWGWSCARTFWPTRSANFFYRKGALRKWILSAKRVARARDVDFTYTHFQGTRAQRYGSARAGGLDGG